MKNKTLKIIKISYNLKNIIENNSIPYKPKNNIRLLNIDFSNIYKDK